MELKSPPTDNTSPVPTVTLPDPAPRKPKKSPLKTLLMILLIVALAGGGGAAYWMRDKQAKKQAKSQADQIADLQKQLADNQAGESEEKTATETEKTATENSDNIAAAISSGNTAALEGYMASKVRVIIAASEGVGDRTPTQAISDLKYLDDAKDPWDFDLAPVVLSQYQSGGYGLYFPLGAVVGKSADGMVVSFSFDAVGDINGIFMAADAELLTQ